MALQVKKSYKIINRYKDIISLVVAYGFGDILEKTNIQKAMVKGLNVFSKDKNKFEDVGTYARIRLLLEELGPVFIKFGQMLSQRIDILPKDFTDELSQLQNSVAEIDGNEIVAIIEEEFGKKIDELYKDFSIAPLASASIAQVHKAIMFDDSQVVIKVQRPNIEKFIKTDTEIMLHLAKVLENHINYFKIIGIVGLIKEFKESLTSEVNFSIEVSNINRFRANFKKESYIKVPKVYAELCGKKVITMDFIEGVTVNEYEEKEGSITKDEIAKQGFQSIFKQIFEDGFFHADPHPGNIYISDNKICFLDFGLMGSILPTQKKMINKILLSASTKDTKKIINALVALTGDTSLLKNRDVAYDIERLIDKYYWLDLNSISVSSIFDDFNMVIYKYNVKIPPNFFLLIKALISFESVGRNLSQEFNILQEMEKNGKALFLKSAIPSNLMKDLYFNLTDVLSLLKNMPSEMISLLEQLKMGQLKIEFEHVGLETLSSTLKYTVNKLISAIILASLIIGSSVIIHSNIPPIFMGIPIIGIIIFVIAALWGLFLLVVMIREK